MRQLGGLALTAALVGATAPYPPGTTHGWTQKYTKVRHEPPAETYSVPDLVCSRAAGVHGRVGASMRAYARDR